MNEFQLHMLLHNNAASGCSVYIRHSHLDTYTHNKIREKRKRILKVALKKGVSFTHDVYLLTGYF
jgi:hypothetical protein